MSKILLKNSFGEIIGEVSGAIPTIEPETTCSRYPLIHMEPYHLTINAKTSRRGMYKLKKYISKSFYGSNNYRRMHHIPMYRRKDRECMKIGSN